MYTSFFGLSEKPFAITPNPRYLYMSERHAEALAHLLYGLNEAGGFIQLTGEVGTGKTTVIRTLLEQLPQHADVAVILNPSLTPTEFLLAICEELGIPHDADTTHSGKNLVDMLNVHLLDKHAKGRRVVVIVDEAQNLSAQTLEQVRLLTNLETATQKLLQIILIGQPELRELLARSELRQLAQRITGRYHLTPLARDDTAAYVQHRLKVAGVKYEVFNEAALREVHRVSGGVPRLINIICDRALLGAYTQEQHEIGPRLVRQAAHEVAGHWRQRGWRWWLQWSAVTVGVLFVGIVISTLWRVEHGATPAVPVVVVNATKPVAAIVPPQPTAVDVNVILKQFPDATTTDGAFAALFSLWHAHLDATAGEACEQAVAAGLACVYQKGTWGQLRGLNRPAILQLSDDNGVAHQVAVATVTDGNAYLALGIELHEVTLASLSRYWNGDFLVLWRPQLAGQHTISAGMHSNAVSWLRNSLGAAQNNTPGMQPPATSTKDFFDDALTQQVADFQREHHLTADGVAGVQTQVALDALINRDNGPLLAAALETHQATHQTIHQDTP